MTTNNLAATVSPLALMGVSMTPAERARGRYMRAPDGHEGDGGDAGAGDGGDAGAGGGDAGQGGAGDGDAGKAGGEAGDAGKGGDGGDAGAKDWRAEMAGEDKDLLGFMGRYHSKDAFLKGFKKLNDDMRSGKFIKPLDENSTDEEKAAWAKANGVPETPEAYLEKLPDGLVIGDDDKPAVDAFVKAMHAAGAPKGVADAALKAYYDIVDEQMGAQAEANNSAKQATEDALREEWGADYRRNVNVLKGAIDALPEGVGEALTNAVGGDGVQILNNAEVIKWLMGITLDQNPLATVVPGAGANQASAIAEEIAKIESTMRSNRAAYNRDEKMQARYRELLAARDKLPK